MKRQILLIVVGAALIGCGDSSAVSRNPSPAEIDQGKQRRLEAIDKIQGISEEQRARMKQQIGGNVAPTARTP